MPIVCSKCDKSLTVRESISKTHQCIRPRPKSASHMIRKTADGDYVKRHFMELIAAEMRKTHA